MASLLGSFVGGASKLPRLAHGRVPPDCSAQRARTGLDVFYQCGQGPVDLKVLMSGPGDLTGHLEHCPLLRSRVTVLRDVCFRVEFSKSDSTFHMNPCSAYSLSCHEI